MMAWAIFTEPFNYDRRPRQAIAFMVAAKAEPQSYPRDVIDAAVAAGKATEVPSPRKTTTTLQADPLGGPFTLEKD
jgi:hypothetical protein